MHISSFKQVTPAWIDFLKSSLNNKKQQTHHDISARANTINPKNKVTPVKQPEPEFTPTLIYF